MVGKRDATQYGFLNPPPPKGESRVDRLLQRIDKLVDFEPVREMVAPHFAENGRPSIDPVLMIKMMVVGYLLAIPSDRQLVEECADRISVRRFLALGLTDSLPAHSSFTHWRQRLGTPFFRALLHNIVEQCQSHGMTLSGDRTVDGTMVKAQASRQGPVVQVPEGWDIDEYLSQLSAEDPEPESTDPSDDPGDEPPDDPGDEPPDDPGDGPPDSPPANPPPKQKLSGTPINTHDPDARLIRKSVQDIADFRYVVSLCADAHNGLITDAIAYARECAATAAEHVLHDPGRVERLAADGLYDDGAALAQLYWQQVRAFVPATKHARNGQLGREHFRYDAERDVYICPNDCVLKLSRYRKSTGQSFYVARETHCRSCPLKGSCTEAKRRTVTRQDNEWARDLTMRDGPEYELLQRRRRVNEHLNLMAKRDHGMHRARGLGLDAMRIQAALTAAAIDMRKLVQFDDRRRSGALLCAFLALFSAHIAHWRRLIASMTARGRLTDDQPCRSTVAHGAI